MKDFDDDILGSLYSEMARKNPEQNPKKYFQDYYSKYKDDPDVYISFRSKLKKTDDNTKIGINPKSSFDTPNGIYTYPLQELAKASGDPVFVSDLDVPFQGDQPIIQIFRNNNEYDFIEDIIDITQGEYQTYLNKLLNYFVKYLSSHGLDDIDQHSLKMSIVSRAEDEAFDDSFGGRLWNVTRIFAKFKKYLDDIKIKDQENALSEFNDDISSFLYSSYNTMMVSDKKSANTWSWLWYKILGVGGVADKFGRGIIHRNERIQAVFFTPKQLDVIDIIKNDKDKSISKLYGRNTDNYPEELKQEIKNNNIIAWKIFKDLYSRPNNKISEYVYESFLSDKTYTQRYLDYIVYAPDNVLDIIFKNYNDDPVNLMYYMLKIIQNTDITHEKPSNKVFKFLKYTINSNPLKKYPDEWGYMVNVSHTLLENVYNEQELADLLLNKVILSNPIITEYYVKNEIKFGNLENIPDEIWNIISQSDSSTVNIINILLDLNKTEYPKPLFDKLIQTPILAFRVLKKAAFHLDEIPRPVFDVAYKYAIDNKIDDPYVNEDSLNSYATRFNIKLPTQQIGNESIDVSFKNVFNESFTINQINSHKAYELFSQEYLKATGNTWDETKFLRRAQNWEFYGDENGYIAVRPQRSGFVKLVGSAGSNKSKLRGLNELISKNLPVWGMVSSDIKNIAIKKGFISPPAWMIKLLIKTIPKEVFGGVDFKINSDGSITLSYSDVGDARKYFIATKPYFKQLLSQMGNKLPNMVKIALKKFI